ncbi:MAG TPA: hypothetical protein VEK05_00275 [Burkholderiales bacterium]|nr:hypothetical protein [Burkholderiales bacterium]
MRRFARVAHACLSLLLGWLAVIFGFGLLVVGILGVVAGQVIWSIAWAVMAAAKVRLADLVSEKEKPETESDLEGRALPASQTLEQRRDMQAMEEPFG